MGVLNGDANRARRGDWTEDDEWVGTVEEMHGRLVVVRDVTGPKK